MNFSFDSLPISLFPGAGFAWIVVMWLLTAIVRIGFTCAVFADSQLLWKHLRRRTFLVGGGLWAIATLLGGVFVAAIYWLIHHSALRPQSSPAQAPEQREPPNP